MRFFFTILPIISLSINSVFGYPNYKIAEKNLLKTWENSYPVSFTKIIKKDPTGRGILEIHEKKKSIYIYTFLVFLPRYQFEENKPIPMDEGKEIFVKLYYDPSLEENPYTIKLGEFEEIYLPKTKAKWIKK